MADEIKTRVRQDSYSIDSEGSQGQVRLTPRGEPVVSDLLQQLVFDGRVFMASNAARETAEAIGTATTWSDTDPALLLDVPSGVTAIPLEIIMNQGGTVAGGNIDVLITLSDKVRYSSAGIAIARQNMRFDEPRGSKCPFYSGSTDIVAVANTDDITLWAQTLVHDVDVLQGGNIHWSARQFIAPVLIGPASLVIYAEAATTQPSFFYTVKWAEFDTAEIT